MSAAPSLAAGTDDIEDLDVFTCPLEGISLIEASAGTGKTWNICGLYLRLLLERELEVQQILVVTFTRAATAELKSRIRERMVATLAFLDGAAPGGDPFVPDLVASLGTGGLTPGRIRERLDAALAAFDEAAIFTIHGYCQRALADTPFAAGQPFAQELGEDDLELRLEVARDFWRRHIANDDCPAELGEILVQSGDSPERWAELLRRCLARPLAERRWPVETAALDDGGLDRFSLAECFAHARRLWMRDSAEATRVLTDACPGLKANIYTAASIAVAAKSWTAWLGCGDPLAAIDLSAGKHELFSAAKIISGTKKGCTAPEHPFFDAAADLLAQRERVINRLALARLALLRRFVEEGSEALRRAKRQHRRLAFDDILSNVHSALTAGEKPWLAGELHRRYPAALIDEFQDTDPLQFDIFRRIYADEGRRGRLFLVGDPKQAIYSFRNADLFTYLEARAHADRRFTLRHNQRSSAALIAACNALFATNPVAFVLPGLSYVAVSEGAKLREAFRDDTTSDGHAALRVWRFTRDADGAVPLRARAFHQAATATAAEIARLISAGAAGRVTVGTRALAPGDIAVLVKSHAQGARMREALAALRVASVELSQASIFQTNDAEELERVLLAIAEPARQPLLLAALATACMGRDAAALDALAADDEALLALMDRFAALREAWLTRGFGVMLRQWIVQEGVSARLLARPDGERRLTNLLHLAECLHEAAQTLPAPEALLRWFATRRRSPGAGEAAQLRLDSDRNLVQIVTIHRAKGLEYDVVFCPFLFDGHAGRGEDGEGCHYHEPDEGFERPVLDFCPEAKDDDAIKARIRRERDAEALRLIYVALTRAVHRCYVVAGCYANKTGGAPSTSESRRALLNWLVAGAGMDHAAWRDHKLDEAAIDAGWAALSSSAAPHVLIEDLPAGRGERVSLAQPPAGALAACPPPAQLPSPWRIGSFSALNLTVVEHRELADEARARDHDARAAALPAAIAAPAPALAPDDILFFPRGPGAGHCLHALFERADFVDPAGWDAAAAAALVAHPQRTDIGEAMLARMLRRLLEDVLAAELPDGVNLGRVPLMRRLTELGFHLPAPALDAKTLNDWLAAHGYAMPRLGFAPLTGFLKGYIDLVFEHDGRFYILDWKSNHLGMDPADYGPQALEAAMQAHGYHLQHLLYGVALHRHLARTLPGYDYEKHFGGVLYLFVRAVRPDWPGAGVFFHRPPRKTLENLDALLAARPAAGRSRKR